MQIYISSSGLCAKRFAFAKFCKHSANTIMAVALKGSDIYLKLPSQGQAGSSTNDGKIFNAANSHQQRYEAVYSLPPFRQSRQSSSSVLLGHGAARSRCRQLQITLHDHLRHLEPLSLYKHPTIMLRPLSAFSGKKGEEKHLER